MMDEKLPQGIKLGRSLGTIQPAVDMVEPGHPQKPSQCPRSDSSQFPEVTDYPD